MCPSSILHQLWASAAHQQYMTGIILLGGNIHLLSVFVDRDASVDNSC